MTGTCRSTPPIGGAASARRACFGNSTGGRHRGRRRSGGPAVDEFGRGTRRSGCAGGGPRRACTRGFGVRESAAVRQQIGVDELPWPQPQEWLAAISASPLTGDPGAAPEAGLVYLDRYRIEECRVAADVPGPGCGSPPGPTPDVDRLFPDSFAEQRAAAEMALSRSPDRADRRAGYRQDDHRGAPAGAARRTGRDGGQALGGGSRWPRRPAKAAARLLEAVQVEVDKLDARDRDRLLPLTATTLHRLLGSRPDTSSRFRHNRDNRLPTT